MDGIGLLLSMIWKKARFYKFCKQMLSKHYSKW